ncbi:hypothetical protein DSO57_1032539 [Entomophthora muscae]|uniref:Uncharacterized protein n=1 Tax=Entomophthora muscae TaxID=34485 RepID=A0ACC2U9D8_9FUNG|nr:hypothetical protein DSO57_1032539 [Entomophthora muscae]
MVQAAKPNLLEEAIALVRDKYDIWVEQATDEHAKENSEWNPFAPVKAHLEDLNRCFDAMFMAQEQGRQPNPPPPTPFKETVGHISKDCTAPCSICKEPSHSNFICEFNPINHDCKTQGLMMAEQNYEAKRALSSSATPQPLNKKFNLEYIVDPDGPSFPFTLIRKHQVCSQGPSPGCKLTPPPMKCTDREDAPSPSMFPPRPWDPDPPRKPPSSPSPPHALEIEDDFENEDHYPCLPDLNKYFPFEDYPHYNIVPVESVPESPHSKDKFPNLPSVLPSLEASPAGAAAWEHRATGQESKDKGPTAFRDHHCSHPGPLGPAMMCGLSANPADLGEPIRSGCGDKFNANSTSYDVDFSNQPIKLHASQDARGPAALSNPGNLNQPIRSHSSWDASAQHALYNSRDLAQPINSSGATCNSMHLASSEFSNLDKPITPDDTMEVDSANILINDCNLAGPITPDDAMDVDSPNALINKCNLNEPIKPIDAMETDTPNELSNNCKSDGPTRSGAAGAKFNCSD